MNTPLTQRLILTSTLILVLWTDSSHGQSSSAATPAVRAGQWELTVDVQGMPFGGGVKSGKTCIKAEQVAASAEQAFIEAAMALQQRGTSEQRPTCTLRDLRREAGTSQWQSTCQGERGSMQGSGSGTLSAERIQMSQRFEVSTPMGKRTLQQTIAAQRTGECS